jgi:hypothetical protein
VVAERLHCSLEGISISITLHVWTINTNYKHVKQEKISNCFQKQRTVFLVYLILRLHMPHGRVTVKGSTLKKTIKAVLKHYSSISLDSEKNLMFLDPKPVPSRLWSRGANPYIRLLDCSQCNT